MGERIEGNESKNTFLMQEHCLTMMNEETRAALLTVLQFNINVEVYFLETESYAPYNSSLGLKRNKGLLWPYSQLCFRTCTMLPCPEMITLFRSELDQLKEQIPKAFFFQKLIN